MKATLTAKLNGKPFNTDTMDLGDHRPEDLFMAKVRQHIRNLKDSGYGVHVGTFNRRKVAIRIDTDDSDRLMAVWELTD